MNKQFLLAGVAGLALTAASAAQAQSVDYGSLQQMFNEPVTTSATGSPQRSTEAPADMQIISADDIRRSGETSLPGILQRVAGVDVLNDAPGQSDVNVRGYDQVSSPRLLVLVNGRQVYQDHYGKTDWATIPVQLDEIRQIEVVKGPNAALFGFNAVSGVINIITYNPKYDNINVGTVRVGNNGERQVSLATTFKIGPAISVRISGGGEGQNEWKTTGALPLSTSLHDPVSTESNLDAVAQLAPKTDLRVEGSWSNVQSTSMAVYSYELTKTVTTSEKATLTSDTNYGLVQASAYSDQLQIRYPNFGGDWDNTIDVASLQDLFKIGADNTFRIGAEFRHNTLNSSPIGGANVSYNVWAGSGMWNWVINSQLTSTLAVRVDDMRLSRSGGFPAGIPLADNALWDRTLVEHSENYTLAWRPTSADTFRLSFARGIQAPSLIEFGALQLAEAPAPGVTLYVMGNPDLQPAIVTNYEAAYDHDFTVAKVGLRFFVQDWSNLAGGLNFGGLNIAPTLTTYPAINYQNAANSEERGVEVNASGKFTASLGWHADYTYTDVKDSVFAGVDPVGSAVAFRATTPKYRGNVGLDWDQGPWETQVNLHYVGAYMFYNMLDGALAPVNAYGALSARVGYRFQDGVIVAVSGQDLAENRQRQTTGLEAERQVQFTISKAW
jgi:iron complex outermembrane receptor protein